MVNLNSKYGSYALITGAASGIGRAFAEILAQRGMNPIILDINTKDAVAFQNELKEKYKVDARALVLDLSAPDFMQTIIEATRTLDVGLVIHSAAVSIIGEYLEIPLEQHRKLVDVNICSSMEIAYYFCNQFKAQKRGGLILLSSASALRGSALVQHYAASKAYILTLAEGLWYELRPYGVDVLGLMPGSTETPAIHVGNPDLSQSYIMQPVDVALEALDELGRQPSLISGRRNRRDFFLLTRLLSRKLGVEIVGNRLMQLYRRKINSSKVSEKK
jgi:short-subunit dehydrogenase